MVFSDDFSGIISPFLKSVDSECCPKVDDSGENSLEVNGRGDNSSGVDERDDNSKVDGKGDKSEDMDWYSGNCEIPCCGDNPVLALLSSLEVA
ncbi:hypothetical protein JTB14_010819 [Gonioctena quinquepunctata]|nr:hypothetical protein JTB14_010819 [Gonioctena quinquepunctata]